MHALGKAGHPPPEAFLIDATHHLERRLLTEAAPASPAAATPAKALANLMAGFGRLGFYPGDDLAACVREGLLRRLPTLNDRDLRDVLGAWADLAHR